MRKIRSNVKILITAGPTREFIDPVRFISNAATGTIGYLLANIAKRRQHKVILLSGPTHLKPPQDVKTILFNSALELKKEVDKYDAWAECIICSAAVSDFRPKNMRRKKI